MSRFSVLALLFLAACANNPYGFSSSEWDALPASKKAQIVKQAEEDKRRVQAEKDRRDAEKQRVIDGIYQQAEYGTIIECSISDGRVEIFGDFEPYNPVSFRLVRGEEKTLTFQESGKFSDRQVNVGFLQDAPSLAFCPEYEDDITSYDCARVPALDNALRTGFTTKTSFEDLFENVNVSCSYVGQSQNTIFLR